MATIPELATRLRERLGPTRFWVDQELTDALLEAARMWQCYTGFMTGEAAALTDEVYAVVPRQIAWTTRLRRSGTELPRTSVWELDTGFVGWEGSAASSTGPNYWASQGMGDVLLYPPWDSPGDTVFEGPVSLDRGFTAGVELPLSEGDEQALLDYAQHYLSFKEGQGELDNTADMRQALVTRGGKANARLRRQNFFRAGMTKDRGETQPGPQRGSAGGDWVRGGR